MEKIKEKITKKSNKFTYMIILIIIAGVMILVVSYFNDSTPTFLNLSNDTTFQENKREENLSTSTTYQDKVKNELKNILSKVKGVGEVDVIIHFEGGEELIPALDSEKSNTVTEERDSNGGNRVNNNNKDGTKVVMSSQGSSTEPLILKTYNPKIIGILIVAEGADDTRLSYELTKIVSSLYDISESKVSVIPMKEQ
ncbi:stage III sporulation protein AG [Candidatus Arthromitus sp. SFB-turkey]|uniref:stage III sporulation protein AG n=1 Tax=Candidatus Arthromitus sp. SFB-turkey TaxID=1840217 RepID=UPI0007F51648|nr:stage III sporulation protein AG [Candidatus Arthromitus sp. SFB-turkey]OAT86904.1 stage III sporulation protein AG [Candidatus Arthromitus sp. SFB-turkey]